MVVHRQRGDDRLCRDAQTRQWRQLERNRRDRSKSRVAVTVEAAVSAALSIPRRRWTAATTTSVFAFEEIVCEHVESVAFYTESRQCSVRLFREAFRFRARFLQTNDGRVSRLLCGDIFARAFAKFFTGLCHIENVVDHLKRQTERASELCDRTELFRICIRAHCAESD